MWLEVTGRLVCKRLLDAEDWCGGPPAVPTRTFRSLWLMFAHVALGVRYIELAPVMDISVSDGGSSDEERLSGTIIGGRIITLGDTEGITRGGLQIGLEILKEFVAIS